MPNPDVQSVTISYDDVAGSITASVRFHADYKASRFPDVWLSFGLAESVSDETRCSFNVLGEDDTPRASGTVYPPSAFGFSSVHVDDFAGSVDGAFSEAADGREVVATFVHPEFVGIDWRCAEVSSLWTTYYEFSWCSDPGCPIAPPPAEKQSSKQQKARQFKGLAKRLMPTARRAKYDRRVKLKRVRRPSPGKRAGFRNGWEADFEDRGLPVARASVVVSVYETARQARAAYRDACPEGCKRWKAGRALGATSKGGTILHPLDDGTVARCAGLVSVRKTVYMGVITCGAGGPPGRGYTTKNAGLDAKFLSLFVHRRAIKLSG